VIVVHFDSASALWDDTTMIKIDAGIWKAYLVMVVFCICFESDTPPFNAT
jgi:hypothetical protein